MKTPALPRKFLNDLKEQLKRIFPGLEVEIRDPELTWQRALSEGESFTALIYVRYRVNGEERKELFGYIPLLTPRKTFVVDGRERLPLKVFELNNPPKKGEPLREEERTRDLRGFRVKEYDYYGFYRKVLEKVVDRTLKRNSQNLPTSLQDLIGGTDFYKKLFTKYHTFFPYLDSTNPLSELEALRKISFLRGGKTKHGRDIHPTHYGRLCVVETPESEKIGMKLHLAHKAEIKRGKIVTPLKESCGTAKKLEPDKDGYIADATTELNGKVLVRGGRDGRYVDTSEVTHIDTSDDQLFGYAALQVPFIQYNDPARALMGAKNLKQACPLLNPEPPLIQTGYERAVAELSGRLVKSTVSGVVEEINNERIVIKDKNGNKAVHHLLRGTHLVNADTAFYQVPVVKEGDKVKKGDIIAEGTGIRDGILSLGANFLVAYMPYYGYNMDDAIVVSKRVADRLTSVHIKEFVFDKEEGDIPLYVAKTGLHIKRDNEGRLPLLVIIRGKTKDDVKNFYPKQEMLGGTLNRILIEPEKIRILVEKRQPLQVGDKIMGRHGNKGVVAKILPTNQMPFFEIVMNGRKERRYIDIILNPHGVISRMNLGQLLETHLGWVAREHPVEKVRKEAQKSGKPFNKVDLEKLSRWLEQSGLDGDGKIRLFLEDKKATENPVVVGYQYIVKLNHLAEDKISVRGEGGPVSCMTGMPLKGKRAGGGQRFGEMEVWGLLGHNTEGLLREILGKRSNACILETGATSISESLKVLVYLLRGLGISLLFYDKEGEAIEPEDFDQSSSKLIKDYSVRYAQEQEIKNWGRHIDVNGIYKSPKKIFSASELFRDIKVEGGLEKIIEHNGLDFDVKERKGRRYAYYLDEMGYIDLVEPVELMGRQLKVLPVIPLRCRPHADDRINRLYRRIIACNARLDKLRRNKALKKTLQSHVKDLEKELKRRINSKNGVIRKTILGKRVNLSGRAVIVPASEIKADEVSLSEEIMRELDIKKGEEVLLNRQPTLHPHNLQVFRALKNTDKVIGIHPLVCSGFNADFDGDTMAVYKILNKDALSKKHIGVSGQIFLSANGRFNLNLSQDIGAGIYLATMSEEGRKELAGIINDRDIYNGSDDRPVDVSCLHNILLRYFLKHGGDRVKTLRLAEKITTMGLRNATERGITLGIYDLYELATATDRDAIRIKNAIRINIDTKEDKDKLEKEIKKMEEKIERTIKKKPSNPVNIMLSSGARGKISQVRQMVGARGIVERISGGVVSTGIASSYMEGFSPTEYYLACYGARKSLGDKKLVTPECGYLTRKLVFSASDLRISSTDCKTTEGIVIDPQDAFGRTILEDTLSFKKGTVIDVNIMEELKNKGIDKIKVRSPITCALEKGICKMCYGWELSRRDFPKRGFNVGILSAMVIGERATQDAMRTYHQAEATGIIKVLDNVRIIFDRGIDPEKSGDQKIKDKEALLEMAYRLYNYYERKVNLKHYEVMLRALFVDGELRNVKEKISRMSPLHRAGFERPVDVFRECIDKEFELKSETVLGSLFK